VNPFDALMRAAPGDPQDVDVETLQVVREAMVDCIDLLTPEHQWIINSLYMERLTTRAVGKQLGISHVHVMRLRNVALQQLQATLSLHPIIRERLKMDDVWESAAFNHLLTLHTDYTGDTKDDLRTQINTAWTLVGAGSVSQKARDKAVDALSLLGGWAMAHTPQYRENSMEYLMRVTDLLASKQHDYGSGNINRFGLVGLVVRMSDKVERYENLRNRPTPSNETLQDTLDDMVGYAVIARMVLDNSFNLPLGADL
jgi:hypothetical protein